MTGRVLSLNISKNRGTVKLPMDSCRFIEGLGLENDAHAVGGIRQVSLLANESIHKMREQCADSLEFGSFAENITTEGIVLYELPIGTRLKIGETVQEVSKIGKSCHNDCEIKRKIGSCVMPTEGIFTRIISGGIVRVGDEIIVIK